VRHALPSLVAAAPSLRRQPSPALTRRRRPPHPPTHPTPQISCAWGFTTTGGAKGVGESTTSAVVISLVTIFVADFFLSFLFFQGQGDALKQLK
jgi:hypothetical protein